MTSVGGTTGITETAATFSSGGFSNFFAQPSYQTAAVEAYLSALGKTNAGKFNTSGRAFPDVSAQAENVEIIVGGETGTVAGTSCASPIFASVISLLNDRLIAAGQPSLGFLNPFLYSAAGSAALNDITTGKCLPLCFSKTLTGVVAIQAITRDVARTASQLRQDGIPLLGWVRPTFLSCSRPWGYETHAHIN